MTGHRRRSGRTQAVTLCLLPLLLAGCADNRGWLMTVGPDYKLSDLPLVGQWLAPAPPAPPASPEKTAAAAADPRSTSLLQWWDRFNDPALSALLLAAQKDNATLAEAAARIADARAALIASGGFEMQGVASASRSAISMGGPALQQHQMQIGLQLQWELDLFGGLARDREAASAALEREKLGWHDARLSVAVETANAYVGYRVCRAQADLARREQDSWAADLVAQQRAAEAGLRGAGELAQAEAAAADSRSRLTDALSRCDQQVKGLAALTGLNAAELQSLLNSAAVQNSSLPVPPPFRLEPVPARLLRQRPDIAAAERAVAEASARIGSAVAERYPQVSLTGSITPTRIKMGGSPESVTRTWSFGPGITLPLLDGGARAARVDAAEAHYTAALRRYETTARLAVADVEQVLTRIAANSQRLPDQQSAVQSYRSAVTAAEKRYALGLISLIELESLRRAALAAEQTLIAVQQATVLDWIALYRASGGDWTGSSDTGPVPASASNPASTNASATNASSGSGSGTITSTRSDSTAFPTGSTPQSAAPAAQRTK